MSKFHNYVLRLLGEAPEDQYMETPEDNSDGQEQPGMDETMPMPEQEPVAPEEIELAKLAVRALYFNAASKNLHNKKLKYKGEVIPFEKISDFFEETKAILPVLYFVEKLMDSYEGLASKWTEREEVKGKSIIDKIEAFSAVSNDDEKLDNGKRVYWTRIILNCLLNGSPDYNLVISDINEDTIPEIFNMLKQHFGRDTRGMVDTSIELRTPYTS
jgi:hypothetical protein